MNPFPDRARAPGRSGTPRAGPAGLPFGPGPGKYGLPSVRRLHPTLLALGAALALAAPRGAGAAAPGDPLTAARRSGPITVDGRFDEPDWERAPAYDGFVQQFPDEGAPPSEQTLVRVLYDDHALYVGVRCRDRHPEAVQRPLGRRDAAPYSDAVTIYLDPLRAGRSAFVFSINAGGVLGDGLLSFDDLLGTDWDAVWDGAVAASEDGWSAELAIPLAALRFSDGPEQTFGFAVKRTIARRHEDVLSVVVPRSSKGSVARLAPLGGLSGLAAVQDLQLAPYLATRAIARPQYSDALRPRPRLREATGDVGLDVRGSLGRGLTLQGALNPDFGQVEADAVVLNLTRFELFFPEKRPFFTEGMDLFAPVAAPNRTSPQQLFYSRRIGLDAPIFGAAKVTGAVSDTVQIGLLETFVDGASARTSADAYQATPPRDVRYDPAQPFRLGSRSALPLLSPPAENFLVGVARYRPDPTRTFGATVTSAALGGPRCTAAEDALDDDHRPRRCDALAGNAAALDLDLRSADGAWYLRGQATGSQASGGAPLRILPDGTRLRRGALGAGGHVAAGRQGGEPWRFELQWEYESPTLDLNAAGFQRTQNEQLGRAILRYARPSGGGPFHSYGTALGYEAHYTTDGAGLNRGRQLFWLSNCQLRSFDWIGLNVLLDLPSWDVREVDQAGVPLAQPASLLGEIWYATDPSRPVAVEGWLDVARSAAVGPLRPTHLFALAAKVTVRPHPRVETKLEVQLDRNSWGARWVTDGSPDADGVVRTRLFGALTAPSLSLTLRQQLVLTARLTLQAYAQLFTSYGRYGPYYAASAAPGQRIRSTDLHPVAFPAPGSAGWEGLENPDFRQGALNLSVVLRWEHRLGSVLYLVYTRAQQELGWPDAPADPSPPLTLHPHQLARGPATDTVLAKWTFWWRR